MGRWSLVQCDCPNREPLEHSRWGAYACGHQDGAIIAFAPNDLLGYGQDLDRIYKEKPDMFEVWRRIGDWRKYDDEYLSISPDEVKMWELEIEELKHFLPARSSWAGTSCNCGIGCVKRSGRNTRVSGMNRPAWMKFWRQAWLFAAPVENGGSRSSSSGKGHITTACTRPRLALIPSARHCASCVVCAAGDAGRWAAFFL